MITNNDVVDYCRTWLGTKWVHQGRTERGIDCAGLLMVTIWNFDLDGEDLPGYRRDPGRQFLQQIRTYTDRRRPMKPIHGAIGIFNDTVMPCHTGVFAVDSKTGRVTVIHSDANHRRCVEEGFDDATPSLRDRLTDIRLFRPVDYGE